MQSSVHAASVLCCTETYLGVHKGQRMSNATLCLKVHNDIFRLEIRVFYTCSSLSLDVTSLCCHHQLQLGEEFDAAVPNEVQLQESLMADLSWFFGVAWDT